MGRDRTANPVPWLLLTLLLAVGLPFFVVAATAPLLQKWFADTDHPAARDPYFLYAASNLGSMTATRRVPLPRRTEPDAGRSARRLGRRLRRPRRANRGISPCCYGGRRRGRMKSEG